MRHFRNQTSDTTFALTWPTPESFPPNKTNAHAARKANADFVSTCGPARPYDVTDRQRSPSGDRAAASGQRANTEHCNASRRCAPRGSSETGHPIRHGEFATESWGYVIPPFATGTGPTCINAAIARAYRSGRVDLCLGIHMQSRAEMP
jgi:hypothetical protein